MLSCAGGGGQDIISVITAVYTVLWELYWGLDVATQPLNNCLLYAPNKHYALTILHDSMTLIVGPSFILPVRIDILPINTKYAGYYFDTIFALN